MSYTEEKEDHLTFNKNPIISELKLSFLKMNYLIAILSGSRILGISDLNCNLDFVTQNGSIKFCLEASKVLL